MQRSHGLMYVLSAIVLLNVIAIVVLHNRLPEPRALDSVEQPVQPETQPSRATPPETPRQTQQDIVVAADLPPVRTLILEDSDTCPDCFDIRAYVSELSDLIEMELESADPFLFRTDRLPALAFNGTIESYDLTEGWEGYGYTIRIPTGEYAGTWYVLPTLNPPYLDTKSNTVKGRVTVTYLTMRTCGECYDVMLNREFLQQSRITPHEEVTVDVSSREGKRIVDEYGITAVPTILLSEEAAVYGNIQPGWPIVGTIENDGTYVLRDLQRLKVVYYDLERREVMTP